jgi:hypothetical protein
MFDEPREPSLGNSIWSALFDSDWRQRADIDDLTERTESMARQLGQEHGSLEAKVDALERRVAELALVNRTLLAVLLQQGVLREDAFNYQLRTFDLEDGKIDNR